MPLSPSSRYIIPDLPSADELAPFLRQIDQNKWYSNFGPLVRDFENSFLPAIQQNHSTKVPFYVTTMVTGYHALAVGLSLLGVKNGDKVLVPSITFPACPFAVQHTGGEAILTDVDETSWTLTPAIARQAAAKNRIKAVMPVAVYGVPLPAKEWDDFTRETGIPVIIDAAAAIESQEYLETGFVAHSLHALKPFGIGEGGLLVSANNDLIAQAQQYSNFGTIDRITYRHGENAKMSEFHAAVALAQLSRWPQIKQRRQAVFDKYKTGFAQKVTGASLHPNLDQAITSALMLRLHSGNAKDVMLKIQDQGIFAHRTYFPPLHEHPHFAGLGVVSHKGIIKKTPDMARKAKLLPNTEKLNSTVLGLPFHAFLADAEIATSIEALNKAI